MTELSGGPGQQEEARHVRLWNTLLSFKRAWIVAAGALALLSIYCILTGSYMAGIIGLLLAAHMAGVWWSRWFPESMPEFVGRLVKRQHPPPTLRQMRDEFRVEFRPGWPLTAGIWIFGFFTLDAAGGRNYGSALIWLVFAALCWLGRRYRRNPEQVKAMAGWLSGNLPASPGDLWRSMRGGWRLAWALIGLGVGAGSIWLCGEIFFIERTPPTSTVGIVCIVFAVIGVFSARDGVKKLRAWWRG